MPLTWSKPGPARAARACHTVTLVWAACALLCFSLHVCRMRQCRSQPTTAIAARHQARYPPPSACSWMESIPPSGATPGTPDFSKGFFFVSFLLVAKYFEPILLYCVEATPLPRRLIYRSPLPREGGSHGHKHYLKCEVKCAGFIDEESQNYKKGDRGRGHFLYKTGILLACHCQLVALSNTIKI